MDGPSKRSFHLCKNISVTITVTYYCLLLYTVLSLWTKSYVNYVQYSSDILLFSTFKEVNVISSKCLSPSLIEHKDQKCLSQMSLRE